MMTRIEQQAPTRWWGAGAPGAQLAEILGVAGARRARILWRSLVRGARHTVLSPVARPIVFSLALHIALCALLLSTSWSAIGGGGGGYARAEVVINLPAAAPPVAPSQAPASAGEVLRPAPVEGALPRLQGLSTPALSSLPVLRSGGASADVTAADLLRTQNDSHIGGATFAGLGTRQAASVVYVVDASGAMVTSLQFVLAELERSVRNLSSAQKFQVVLFRDRTSIHGGTSFDVFTPPGVRPERAQLVSATPANKAALSQWLKDIRPTGRSNPIDGLRRGLAFEPDAIFLLSRSIRRSGGELSAESPGGVWGRPTVETLAELDRLNPRRMLSGKRRVVIKAIQFLEEDPTGTMQAIGQEHGDGPGSYTVLTLQALGGR
jgi:hypothetical protein